MANQAQTSFTTISQLPDECLRVVFRQIPETSVPGEDFINLRTVCKRWSKIIDDCWRGIDTLVLIVAPNFSLKYRQNCLTVSAPNNPTKTSDEILKRCAPYLKSLMARNLSPALYSVIPLAATLCQNLKVFGWQVKTKSDGQHLRDFLKACTTITTLEITILDVKVYNFYQTIPTHQLRQLTINTLKSAMYDLQLPKYIKATIRNSPVLERLQIDFVDEELSRLLTGLHELHLGRVLLRFEFPRIMDEILLTLSANCRQLTSITIEECMGITDEGISALSLLPKLKVLKLCYLPKVNGQSLKKFSKIEKVWIEWCNVGDAELKALLKNCHVLRLLGLQGCNITERTLSAAVEETKKRTNNIPLLLHCMQSNINLKKFDGASSLLKVIL